MKINKGFTLIELLVVVLIIGILAAIAVPQYQIAVEKSIMQEAIVNLKAIAQANDVFFLANGRYAYPSEISKLDITIPGTLDTEDHVRIDTKYFRYSPDAYGDTTVLGHKAYAKRLPADEKYNLFISSENILKCAIRSQANNIQQKLCKQINKDGHL